MSEICPDTSFLESMHEFQRQERRYLSSFKFRKIFDGDMDTNEFFTSMIMNAAKQFGQSLDTGFRAVFIYEYVLEKTKPKGRQFVLIALASLLLSSKLFETKKRQISLKLLEGYYDASKEKIKKVEDQICEIFNWNFNFVTPYSFLWLFMECPFSMEGYDCLQWEDMEHCSYNMLEFAMDLLNSVIYDFNYLRFRPSVVAAAILYCARVRFNLASPDSVVNRDVTRFWPRSLVLFTQISASQMPECVDFVEDCFAKYLNGGVDMCTK